MTISDVRCEVKKEQLCSVCPEQVIELNIIATVQNGKEFIDIPIKDFINEIFDIAIVRANEHISKNELALLNK